MLVTNFPVAPCLCCTNELCINDRVTTSYVDKPPFRSGMCCFCIPCTCCGPPVIFSKTPKCLCFDLTPCFGQMIMAAPANFFGLKKCCCCCSPCYTTCAYPLVNGVAEANVFMANMKSAADAYHLKHPEIDATQRAIFEEITDNISIIGTNKPVENEEMNRHL